LGSSRFRGHGSGVRRGEPPCLSKKKDPPIASVHGFGLIVVGRGRRSGVSVLNRRSALGDSGFDRWKPLWC
jgi:hypothetical protein